MTLHHLADSVFWGVAAVAVRVLGIDARRLLRLVLAAGVQAGSRELVRCRIRAGREETR